MPSPNVNLDESWHALWHTGVQSGAYTP